MVVIKTKKSAKQRGTRTHGWGAGKKHRGAGHRGGKGNAGAGKRGQQRKTKFLAQHIQTLRKRKTHPHIKRKISTITLEQITFSLEKWLSAKKIKKEKDTYIINLSELGFDKLLGTGKFTDKVDITVKNFTAISKTKVESLKGKLNKDESSENIEA